MSKIIRQDTNGVKPLLAVGELGYDNYPSGGDIGRVFVGTGTQNIAQAKLAEVVAVDGKVDTHVGRVDNPHAVTKAQVGLSNVDNTSDTNKPISTSTQNALDLKQNVLVSGTNIKTIEGQSIVGTGNIDLFKNDVGLGNVDNTADTTKVVASAGKWTTSRLINGTAVDGTVDITTSQWGTSRNITIGDTTKSVNGSADISWSLNEVGAIGTASPTFTGVPTAPTAAVNNNSNQIATTAYVASQVANTAVALTGNQTVDGIKTFSSNIVGNITGNAATATRVNNTEVIKFDTGVTEGTDLYTFDGSVSKTINIKAGTNVTLTKTAGSVTINANDTSIAVTEITGMGAGANTFLATPTSTNLAAMLTDETGTGAVVFANSPTLTGTPLATTAVVGTNTTQIATTAFVLANASAVNATTVGNATAGIATGGIGSYAFALYTNEANAGTYTISPGATVAGSKLYYCDTSGYYNEGNMTLLSSLINVGTWKCGGAAIDKQSNAIDEYHPTLWVRIA